jgi:hypothetical protein
VFSFPSNLLNLLQAYRLKTASSKSEDDRSAASLALPDPVAEKSGEWKNGGLERINEAHAVRLLSTSNQKSNALENNRTFILKRSFTPAG